MGIMRWTDLLFSRVGQAFMGRKPKAIVFGASNCGKAFLEERGEEYEVVAFADNDSDKHGTFFQGVPVIAPEAIPGCEFDLVIVTSMFFPEIRRQLVDELRVPREAISCFEPLRTTEVREVPRALPAKYRGAVLRATAAVSDDRSAFREISNELVALTEGLEPTSVSVETWLGLRYVLMRQGFLEASGIARDNARTLAIASAGTESGASDPSTLLCALRASMDSGDLVLSKSFRDALCDLESGCDALPVIDSYLGMCLPGQSNGADSESIKSEDDFRELIAGKSVAVVGPAASDEQQGAEIEAFDVVVRPGYWGSDRLPPPSVAGSRTDISYYNAPVGLRITRAEYASILADLKYSVFRRSEHVVPGLSARAVLSPDAVFFAGFSNQIPRIVFDLLSFRPSSLKVFCSNFYLSTRRYHESYVADDSGFLKGAATHDLCSQVNFVRNLCVNELVDFDQGGSRVLRMSNQEYLRAMEGLMQCARSCESKAEERTQWDSPWRHRDSVGMLELDTFGVMKRPIVSHEQADTPVG